MSNRRPSSFDAETARRVLRALCDRSMDGAQRNLYAHLLSGYEWREPMNQIIFHCLLLVPRRAGEALREHLAACATRKGFPEFDWVEFFLAQPTTQEELEAFIRELRNSV